MLDCAASPVLHRSSLHLADPHATTLTDEITLIRSAFAAEMKEAGAEVHCAVLLPQALYVLWGLPRGDDPLPRLKQIGATFQRHAQGEVRFACPVTAPLTAGQYDRVVAEFEGMPVAWELCDRPEEWPHSSIHRRLLFAQPTEMRAAS
ncbi:MAG: hypothetical protein AAFR53_13060 [Pseudomonadota bacterium]